MKPHTRESVMAKVDTSQDCWRWLGSHTGEGRPQVNFDRQAWYVYRLLYTWMVGPIPEGLTLDHLSCDNGWCCNPHHCVPATNTVNVTRGLAVRYAGRDTCPQGHSREQYGRLDSRGKRWCVECNRAKMKARYTPAIPRTECTNGHSREEYGTKYSSGWQCRECNRLRARERRARSTTSKPTA